MDNQDNLPQDIETSTRWKYEHQYGVQSISITHELDEREYFANLVRIRLEMLQEHAAGKVVLDIGCGSGDYLFRLKDTIARGVGIDFTDQAISTANQKKDRLGARHLDFIRANAKELPFEDNTFDLVYSFSVLANVPQVKDAIKDSARVLKPGGVAVLELGNKNSLNTLVCRAYPELAQECHVKIQDIRQMLSDAGYTVDQWRSFGVLPYWGEKPANLRFLLHPWWKSLCQNMIGRKMIDEWLAESVFRPWAYRQIIRCRK